MQDNSQDNTNNGSTNPPTPITPTPEIVPTDTSVTVPPVVPVETVTTPVNATPTVAPTEPTTVSSSSARSRTVTQYAIAGFIILLMGVGLLYVLEAQGRVNTGVFATINELVNPAPAAAVVNGVKIPLATYEKNRAQIEQNAAGQGLTVTDDDVKAEISKQAIDVLVNTELLKQAAAKNGVVVTEEQIDARYDEIVASLGGEAALNAKMLELSISPESLQTDIRGEILIQAYLTQAVDLSVVKIDEAAIKTVYDQANTPEANLPPLDEVRADIEAQLKSTQEQELVNAHIETLRTDAKIETNV